MYRLPIAWTLSNELGGSGGFIIRTDSLIHSPIPTWMLTNRRSILSGVSRSDLEDERDIDEALVKAIPRLQDVLPGIRGPHLFPVALNLNQDKRDGRSSCIEDLESKFVDSFISSVCPLSFDRRLLHVEHSVEEEVGF